LHEEGPPRVRIETGGEQHALQNNQQQKHIPIEENEGLNLDASDLLLENADVARNDSGLMQ
jgi:hypothetical protein